MANRAFNIGDTVRVVTRWDCLGGRNRTSLSEGVETTVVALRDRNVEGRLTPSIVTGLNHHSYNEQHFELVRRAAPAFKVGDTVQVISTYSPEGDRRRTTLSAGRSYRVTRVSESIATGSRTGRRVTCLGLDGLEGNRYETAHFQVVPQPAERPLKTNGIGISRATGNRYRILWTDGKQALVRRSGTRQNPFLRPASQLRGE